MTLPIVADVITRLDDKVLTIVIDRPESLNALTGNIIRGLAELVSAATSDPGVHLMVLRGSGRAFCAGADVVDGAEAALAGNPPVTPAEVESLAGAIAHSTTPVVAVVQGPAAGLGVTLTAAAHIVVAAHDATFRLAFTRLGLMPEGNASLLLAASIGRARALRMALLSEPLTATAAEAIGLVTLAVDADQLEAIVSRVIRTLRAASSPALAATLKAVNLATLGPWAAGSAHEAQAIPQLLQSTEFRQLLSGLIDRGTHPRTGVVDGNGNP